MKQLNAKTLGIGALAGLTAALLVLGASMQPSFSAVLYAASALPILLVGLGWGNMAAISAVVTAADSWRDRHLAVLCADDDAGHAAAGWLAQPPC